jgi:hypothetical protein
MMRWVGTHKATGSPILGVGLEQENIKRLQAGQPIRAEMELDGKHCFLMIHYGETMADLQAQVMSGETMGPAAEPTVPLGATGNFPDGKLNDEDEGELALQVGADERGNIVLNFGKPLEWIAMPPASARQLAQHLLDHADRATN